MLLAALIVTAHCHVYSHWRYPWPQPCLRPHALAVVALKAAQPPRQPVHARPGEPPSPDDLALLRAAMAAASK